MIFFGNDYIRKLNLEELYFLNVFLPEADGRRQSTYTRHVKCSICIQILAITILDVDQYRLNYFFKLTSFNPKNKKPLKPVLQITVVIKSSTGKNDLIYGKSAKSIGVKSGLLGGSFRH